MRAMRVISLFALLAISSAALVADNLSADSPVSSVTVDGTDFIYEGLVGYGFLSGETVDKYGDTISFGSSMSIQQNSVKTSSDEDGNTVYTLTVYGLPDRGWNTNGTLNFVNRIYKFSAVFTPAAESSTENLVWTYEDSILLKDPSGTYMSGLDCNTTIAFDGFPELPAVKYTGDGFGGKGDGGYRVCLDSEALNLIEGDISKGFWISDEYGPYAYKFGADGVLEAAYQPPAAFLPLRDGKISFSADSAPIYNPDQDTGDNESGRTDNQGFEGFTISPDGKYGYALLQSALVQDGGLEKNTNRISRMVKFDLETQESLAEWAFELPTYVDPAKKAKKNPRTAAQSEILYLSDDTFLVLARDSGHGRDQNGETESIYRKVCVYSVANATDILGQYDGSTDSITTSDDSDEALDSIVTATCQPLIDVNNAEQLANFGLHNGGVDDFYLLNEKWEGMDLFPVEGTNDEFYLLMSSDDDFITQKGFMNFGKFPYADASGGSLDNQALIFKVKLPTLATTTMTTTASLSTYSGRSTLAPTSSGYYYQNSSAAATSPSARSADLTTSLGTAVTTNLSEVTVTTVVPCSTDAAGSVYYTDSTEVLTFTCTLEQCATFATTPTTLATATASSSASSSSSVAVASSASSSSPGVIPEISTANAGNFKEAPLTAVLLSFLLMVV